MSLEWIRKGFGYRSAVNAFSQHDSAEYWQMSEKLNQGDELGGSTFVNTLYFKDLFNTNNEEEKQKIEKKILNSKKEFVDEYIKYIQLNDKAIQEDPMRERKFRWSALARFIHTDGDSAKLITYLKGKHQALSKEQMANMTASPVPSAPIMSESELLLPDSEAPDYERPDNKFEPDYKPPVPSAPIMSESELLLPDSEAPDYERPDNQFEKGGYVPPVPSAPIMPDDISPDCEDGLVYVLTVTEEDAANQDANMVKTNGEIIGMKKRMNVIRAQITDEERNIMNKENPEIDMSEYNTKKGELEEQLQSIEKETEHYHDAHIKDHEEYSSTSNNYSSFCLEALSVVAKVFEAIGKLVTFVIGSSFNAPSPN
jgi:hypothetical protein